MEFLKWKADVTEELVKLAPFGFEIEVKEVTKSNDTVKTGVCLKKSEENICPCVYMEDWYFNDETPIDAAENMMTFLRDAWEKAKNMEANVPEAEQIRNTAIFRMANKARNISRLKNAVTMHIPGITGIINYAVVPMNVGGKLGTMILTWDILEKVGLADGDAYTDLLNKIIENTEEKIHVKKLSSVIAELTGTDEDVFDSPFNIAVGELDASPLTYIRKELKNDAYIIPSSIHELLILPTKEDMDNDRLLEIINEVNTGVLSDEDFLSDNLYFYDATAESYMTISAQ